MLLREWGKSCRDIHRKLIFSGPEPCIIARMPMRVQMLTKETSASDFTFDKFLLLMQADVRCRHQTQSPWHEEVWSGRPAEGICRSLQPH